MKQQYTPDSRHNTLERWCALAEGRLNYLTELFESGRWRRFHSEVEFLSNIREAKVALETWQRLAFREATPDNLPVDRSWLARADRVLSPSIGPDMHQAPENPSSLAEKSIAPSAPVDSPSAAINWKASVDTAMLSDRYPILRNAM